MFGQIADIGKFLRFRGEADYNLNLKGHLNPHRIFKEWNFRELVLNDTNDYTPFIDGSSAIALAADGITLTTAATNAKCCSEAFGGLHIQCARKPTVEFKFKVDVIENVAINAVITDALTEATGVLPYLISGTGITDAVSDAAGFCFDTNQDTDRFYIVNTLNNGTAAGTLLSAVQAPFAAATFITVRVELDASGNALFYFNGKKVGYKALAVTTTVDLGLYFGIRNNNASAHVATVRYVRLWQDA